MESRRVEKIGAGYVSYAACQQITHKELCRGVIPTFKFGNRSLAALNSCSANLSPVRLSITGWHGADVFASDVDRRAKPRHIKRNVSNKILMRIDRLDVCVSTYVAIV